MSTPTTVKAAAGALGLAERSMLSGAELRGADTDYEPHVLRDAYVFCDAYVFLPCIGLHGGARRRARRRADRGTTCGGQSGCSMCVYRCFARCARAGRAERHAYKRDSTLFLRTNYPCSVEVSATCWRHIRCDGAPTSSCRGGLSPVALDLLARHFSANISAERRRG